MKRKDIDSWLSGVLDKQKLPPPSTPPADLNSNSHRTKWRKMSPRETSSSRKRRIEDDTTSSLTDLTDRTRFDPSSGTSRPRSPARDLLNDLPLSSPPIHCTRPKSVPLPEPVLFLRQALSRSFGSRVIPASLKDPCRSPRGSLGYTERRL
ncbi:hypothetical protein BP00DRAFT_20367 [Aspergillus indologenus CBS 114.80]|uniref:Uncharacterized protein n=1 Tax=Aspergillus indologenus CBS 114.80 TaxID=1450541 RepID=A0A2V5IG20_9EURO|nr:hypothetical protein BP00DRAFT_20367 [Aspergillus indologenus CBS 114.80]